MEATMYNIWKPNWEESQKRYSNWWTHNGFLVGSWSAISSTGTDDKILHEDAEDPDLSKTIDDSFLDYKWRAKSIHYSLARMAYPLDIIPQSNCDIGPGSLATLLGSVPRFNPETVWFEQAFSRIEDVPTLEFDENNKWWGFKQNIYKELKSLAQNKYMVGCMDLVENIDVLASLISVEESLVALIDEPEWLKLKLQEINNVWIETYDRTYKLIKNEDNSSGYSAFSVWGDGKSAKLQCDTSAMMSPNQFQEFIVPMLTEQCQHLDNSIYHLDGKECLCHLDHILSIKELNAIEWTPDPSSPKGSDPYWFEMYRKIINAGKSVQIVNVEQSDIENILNGVGTNGVYILGEFKSTLQANETQKMLEKKFNYK